MENGQSRRRGSRRWIFLLPFFIGQFLPLSAWAHDPLAGGTAVWLRPDKMEIEIVMSRTAARRLLDHPPADPITEDNFDQSYRALLTAVAPTLYEVTANGTVLKPLSSIAMLTDEFDVQFNFVYPKPEGSVLRMTSQYFKKMEDGFADTVNVNRNRASIGYADLTLDAPTLEVTLTPSATPPPLPTPPPPPKPASPPPTPTAPPPFPPSVTTAPPVAMGYNRLPLMLAIIVVLAVIWGILRRRQS